MISRMFAIWFSDNNTISMSIFMCHEHVQTRLYIRMSLACTSEITVEFLILLFCLIFNFSHVSFQNDRGVVI